MAIARSLAEPYADCSFRAARQFEKGTAFGSLTRGLSGLPEFSAALGLNLTFLGIGGSVILLVLILSWFLAVKRLACALPFLFTVLAMGWVWSKPWHYGMALTAFLVSVWAAWPDGPSPEFKLRTRLMAASLAVLLVLQLPSTAVTVWAEVQGPYSGSRATAEYLVLTWAAARSTASISMEPPFSPISTGTSSPIGPRLIGPGRTEGLRIQTNPQRVSARQRDRCGPRRWPDNLEACQVRRCEGGARQKSLPAKA